MIKSLLQLQLPLIVRDGLHMSIIRGHVSRKALPLTPRAIQSDLLMMFSFSCLAGYPTHKEKIKQRPNGGRPEGKFVCIFICQLPVIA